MRMQLRLSEQERKVVDLLEGTGAMTPSQISVKTLMTPSDTHDTIRRLQKDGYVVVRETADNADGSMVALTGDMRSALVKKSS